MYDISVDAHSGSFGGGGWCWRNFGIAANYGRIDFSSNGDIRKVIVYSGISLFLCRFSPRIASSSVHFSPTILSLNTFTILGSQSLNLVQLMGLKPLPGISGRTTRWCPPPLPPYWHLSCLSVSLNVHNISFRDAAFQFSNPVWVRAAVCTVAYIFFFCLACFFFLFCHSICSVFHSSEVSRM